MKAKLYLQNTKFDIFFGHKNLEISENRHLKSPVLLLFQKKQSQITCNRFFRQKPKIKVNFILNKLVVLVISSMYPFAILQKVGISEHGEKNLHLLYL